MTVEMTSLKAVRILPLVPFPHFKYQNIYNAWEPTGMIDFPKRVLSGKRAKITSLCNIHTIMKSTNVRNCILASSKLAASNSKKYVSFLK